MDLCDDPSVLPASDISPYPESQKRYCPNSSCIPVSGKIPMPRGGNTQGNALCIAFSRCPLPFPISSLPPPQVRRSRKLRPLCFTGVPLSRNLPDSATFFAKAMPRSERSFQNMEARTGCGGGRFQTEISLCLAPVRRQHGFS